MKPKQYYEFVQATAEIINSLEERRYVCKSIVGTYEYDLSFIKEQASLMFEILLPVKMEVVTDDGIMAILDTCFDTTGNHGSSADRAVDEIMKLLSTQPVSDKELHICKYCKAKTFQPDSDCYLSPVSEPEDAIEFAEWITQSVWCFYDVSGKTWTDGIQIIPTQELYSLFKNRKK